MKAKSKTAVLKGGVTDPRLPGKVFFGPGAMQTGFILRTFREQVAEIGEELTARIKGTCFSAKGDDRGDEAKEFVRWIREKISAAKALERKSLAGVEAVKVAARDWESDVETYECGSIFRDREMRALLCRFRTAGMCFVDEALRVRLKMRPVAAGGEELDRTEIVRLVREVYTSDELRMAVFPGQTRCRKPSIQRATDYVRKVATAESRFYDRIVVIRMAAMKLYKKRADGERQFWNSIAQTAKRSHGRKTRDKIGPVTIPQGWR